MTIPNILTIARLFLMPTFLFVYFSPLEDAKWWAMGVLVLSFLTDVLDGYIARNFNQISDMGKILDPIADKTMQITVLLCLALSHKSLIWVVVFVFLKDIVLGWGAIYMYRRGTTAQSNWFGKIACFISVAASLIMIIPFENLLSEDMILLLGLVIALSNAIALIAYATGFFKNFYGKPRVDNTKNI